LQGQLFLKRRSWRDCDRSLTNTHLEERGDEAKAGEASQKKKQASRTEKIQPEKKGGYPSLGGKESYRLFALTPRGRKPAGFLWGDRKKVERASCAPNKIDGDSP